MTDDIHIAFAVDLAYLRQVSVTIASIVANSANPDALHFYVMHAEDPRLVDEEIARWRTANIHVLPVRNPFSALRGTRHVTVASLLRTLLPEALPHLSRLIYLDADLIVLRDIAELWNTDMGDAAMAAAVDIGIYQKLVRRELQGKHEFRDHLLSLGMDLRKQQYINTGLLLMNLDKVRALELEARTKAAHEQRVDGWYVDQSIINALMIEHMHFLDGRWNVHTWTHARPRYRWRHLVPRALQGELAKQRDEQWVIHYTGAQKPWNSQGVWKGDEWWPYARLSGLDWPVPPVTTEDTLEEAWLDIRAAISAVVTRVRKPKYL
jgi:lipopolysaccharide biosynthesis glycosyltransferase